MRSTLVNTFWILALAVIALFLFFLALGAFSPTDVVEVTALVGVLTLAWIVHAALSSRAQKGRDIAEMRARERRGF